MRIQSSNVLLTSQHVAVSEQTKSESLNVWIGNRRSDFENLAVRITAQRHDSVDFSSLNRYAINHHRGKASSSARAGGRDDATDIDSVSMLIRMLTELITGKKVKITSILPKDDRVDPKKADDLYHILNGVDTKAQPQKPPLSGFVPEYDSTETYVEAENMNFSAQGFVRTGDGKQIRFNLHLSMDRAFVSNSSTSIRSGDAVRQQDPLMINFNGSAANLTDTKFSFDLNADGSAEQISFAGDNSGFIALDKNNDGSINNGNELFGTTNGNGFQDLSVYDQDNNGWIDENDAVFNQLSIWSKDSQGNNVLSGLKARGVGALYLGATTSPFELKTGNNGSLGTIRSTGLYLNENGTAGTLQQVDLTL